MKSGKVVEIQVGVKTDGYRFVCEYGVSRVFASMEEAMKVARFVFGVGLSFVFRIADF